MLKFPLWKVILLFSSPLPAIFAGAYIMYHHGVPGTLYMQNIACGILATVVSILVVVLAEKQAGQYKKKRIPMLLFLAGGLLLLLLTLFDSGIQGVHRWISIGPFMLYTAPIILPAMIVWISRLMFEHEFNKRVVAIAAVAFILLLLELQPDASQVTGFAAAIAFLFCLTLSSTAGILITIASGIICTVVSWVCIDNLAPIEYVEGILELTAEMGLFWSVLSIVSLFLILLPFLVISVRTPLKAAAGLGIYYLAVLIAAQFGNFPIPIMGYGVSPILGYYICMTCLLRNASQLVPESSNGSQQHFVYFQAQKGENTQ